VENGENEVSIAHFVDFISESAAAFLIGCFDSGAGSFDELFNGEDYSVYSVFIKVWPDDVDNFVWFDYVAGQWFSPLVVCPAEAGKGRFVLQIRNQLPDRKSGKVQNIRQILPRDPNRSAICVVST
jgi:hypothetical protein